MAQTDHRACLYTLPPGRFAVFSLTTYIRTPLQEAAYSSRWRLSLNFPQGILVILGLGSNITSLRKKPNSPWQCKSFCRFLDFAERGTLVAVCVTLVPTDGKSLATACDTNVIDNEFICACNIVLVPTLDSPKSRESDVLNTWTIFF